MDPQHCLRACSALNRTGEHDVDAGSCERQIRLVIGVCCGGGGIVGIPPRQADRPTVDGRQ
jgi:hypothetical protein